jgi:hypothetical protein
MTLFNRRFVFNFVLQRKRIYIYEWKWKQLTDLNCSNTSLTSVRRVCMTDEGSIYFCIHQFPNATDLTLENISSKNSDLLITTLKEIILLENLPKLDITSYKYSFGKLIELLALISNIVTLKIGRIKLDEVDLVDIQNSETFQLATNMNIIKNLTVTETDEIKEVELLFILCPQLQYFAIIRRQKDAKTLVKLLLSKDTGIAQHLIFLSTCIHNKRYIDTLNKLIQEGKRL